MGSLDTGTVHISLEAAAPAGTTPGVPGFIGEMAIVDGIDHTRKAQVSREGELLVDARSFSEMTEELRRIRLQLEQLTEEKIP